MIFEKLLTKELVGTKSNGFRSSFISRNIKRTIVGIYKSSMTMTQL